MGGQPDAKGERGRTEQRRRRQNAGRERVEAELREVDRQQQGDEAVGEGAQSPCRKKQGGAGPGGRRCRAGQLITGIVGISALPSFVHVLSLASASVEQSLDGAPSCFSRESAVPDSDTHTSVSIASQGALAFSEDCQLVPPSRFAASATTAG